MFLKKLWHCFITFEEFLAWTFLIFWPTVWPINLSFFYFGSKENNTLSIENHQNDIFQKSTPKGPLFVGNIFRK